MAEVSVRSEDTLYYPAAPYYTLLPSTTPCWEGRRGGSPGGPRCAGNGEGMGLKIFSAAQPEVQSSVFQANILVTFPQVTTRIYEKEDYMSMSNTRIRLST